MEEKAMSIKGFIEVRKNGVLVATIDNTIVNAGKGFLQSNIANSSPVTPAYIVTSDASTAVGASDVTCNANVLGYHAVTVTKDPAYAYVEFSCTFDTTESNGTIRSIAICNDDDGTEMFSRGVLDTPITKTTDDTLTVSYKYSLSW